MKRKPYKFILHDPLTNRYIISSKKFVEGYFNVSNINFNAPWMLDHISKREEKKFTTGDVNLYVFINDYKFIKYANPPPSNIINVLIKEKNAGNIENKQLTFDLPDTDTDIEKALLNLNNDDICLIINWIINYILSKNKGRLYKNKEIYDLCQTYLDLDKKTLKYIINSNLKLIMVTGCIEKDNVILEEYFEDNEVDIILKTIEKFKLKKYNKLNEFR